MWYPGRQYPSFNPEESGRDSGEVLDEWVVVGVFT